MLKFLKRVVKFQRKLCLNWRFKVTILKAVINFENFKPGIHFEFSFFQNRLEFFSNKRIIWFDSLFLNLLKLQKNFLEKKNSIFNSRKKTASIYRPAHRNRDLNCRWPRAWFSEHAKHNKTKQKTSFFLARTCVAVYCICCLSFPIRSKARKTRETWRHSGKNKVQFVRSSWCV